MSRGMVFVYSVAGAIWCATFGCMWFLDAGNWANRVALASTFATAWMLLAIVFQIGYRW